jgi:hypothetical protein
VVQAALLGGLFTGVLSALPLIKYANCCCIWIIGGGFVAAYVNQQYDSRPITPGRGALAGLLAGAVGAVVWLITAVSLSALFAPIQEQIASALVRSTPDMPPEVRAFLESLGSSSGAEYAVSFVLRLVGGSIASTIGGLIGAAFFRNDVPPALGGPPPLPPQT